MECTNTPIISAQSIYCSKILLTVVIVSSNNSDPEFLDVHVIFFNCYLAAPRPTLGHYWGDSLNHPMLITTYYIFDQKVTGSLLTRLDP